MNAFEQLVDSLAVSGIDKLEHILRIAKERNVEVPGDNVELQAAPLEQTAEIQPAELIVTSAASDVEVK